jgi:hypothetical protein
MTTPGGGVGPVSHDEALQQPVESKNIIAPAAPAEEAPAPASGLTPDEERMLGELQAKATAASAAGTLRFKVEAPHSGLFFGGLTIGREFTNVPETMAASLVTAAADAGVTLTQE